MKKIVGKITDKLEARRHSFSHVRGHSTPSSAAGHIPPTETQDRQYLNHQQFQGHAPQVTHQGLPDQGSSRLPAVVPPQYSRPLLGSPGMETLGPALGPLSASTELARVPEGLSPDLSPRKRKREVGDSGSNPSIQQRRRSPGSMSQGLTGIISYAASANAERLALIPGDNETFGDIVNLITEYEDVIGRQESLAANLGAKLTGPRLLKGIERFFDGPIRVHPPQPFGASLISWLDVVAFAKANPHEFVLSGTHGGRRCCQFRCKGLQAEITEDDWRLISSGALDRFPIEQPFEEDETAELATLDILEQRTSMLSRKADELAARARNLHHNLSIRKQDIGRRQKVSEGRGWDSPVASGQRGSGQGHLYDLHADLLQQFMTVSSSFSDSRSTSGAGVPVTVAPISPAVSSNHHRLSGQSARSSIGMPQVMDVALAPPKTPVEPGQVDILRGLITQKTDKLSKGDVIYPPCDRCRRLRLQCVKHLTACQGCTKKHAKCSWKAVTEEEAARLRQEMGFVIESDLTGGGPALELSAGMHRPAFSVTPRMAEGLLPIQTAADHEPRPTSREDIISGVSIYSPKTVPGGRFEVEHDVRRIGLQHGQGPGLNPAPGLSMRDVSSTPRMSQMTVAPVSLNETNQSVGSLLNPDDR